jgi:hypothetical protein
MYVCGHMSQYNQKVDIIIVIYIRDPKRCSNASRVTSTITIHRLVSYYLMIIMVHKWKCITISMRGDNIK